MPPKRQKTKSLRKKPYKQKAVSNAKPTPAEAPVPKPDIEVLESYANIGDKNRSEPQRLARFLKVAKRTARLWKENAPEFIIKGCLLSDLRARGKNTEADITLAEKRIRATKDLPGDACSGKYLDEAGDTLVAAFTYRFKTEKPPKRMYYPGTSGRTKKDIDQAPSEAVIWEGLPKRALTRYHQATQLLCHLLPPVADPKDIRQAGDAVTSYPVLREDLEYARDGMGKPTISIEKHERAGVIHLVHCWVPQGRKKGTMTPSRDINRSGKGAIGVEQYYTSTAPVALFLKELFKVSFPAYYKKYEPAFAAGRWTKSDPGPWLGRAIVYKLQVDTHVDGLDDGPAAIFNVGSYSGGKLNLPDLGVILEYGPGDVIIFLSGYIYHHISEWKPLPHNVSDSVTPGRIGNVFFFPQVSYEQLKDKQADWNKNTFTGTMPDATK